VIVQKCPRKSGKKNGKKGRISAQREKKKDGNPDGKAGSNESGKVPVGKGQGERSFGEAKPREG